ncbi:MAG: hypothetical protein M1812_002849 [Candelaria pacifica]|nr:MAG: hypothetical protein M1812_002849 [Candelaria pacifica]
MSEHEASDFRLFDTEQEERGRWSSLPAIPYEDNQDIQRVSNDSEFSAHDDVYMDPAYMFDPTPFIDARVLDDMDTSVENGMDTGENKINQLGERMGLLDNTPDVERFVMAELATEPNEEERAGMVEELDPAYMFDPIPLFDASYFENVVLGIERSKGLEQNDQDWDDFNLFGPHDRISPKATRQMSPLPPEWPALEACAAADCPQEIHFDVNGFSGFRSGDWPSSTHILTCPYLDTTEYQCLYQLERAWYNSSRIFYDSENKASVPMVSSRRQGSFDYASPAQSWRTAPSPSNTFGLTASPAYSDGLVSPAYSYKTAPSPGYTPGSLASIAEQSSAANQTLYMTMIYERGLMLEKAKELNWSDEGQHVEYQRGDKIPLELLSLLGCSNTARVEAVRCKRIKLARKSMVCRNKLSLGDALKEVEHLQRLRHPHIIQLVGSYLMMNRTFAILLYPVCDLDLKAFMEQCQAESPKAVISTPSLMIDRLYLEGFFSCLVNAIRYIHENTTRHMDIKPANILIKKRPTRYSKGRLYHLFIADFGLSSSYLSSDHSQTDAVIGRTPKYCAPEVYAYEKWGRPADVFSLGCVFAEMLTVLACRDLLDFSDFRSSNGSENDSFHSNIPRVKEWLQKLHGFQDEGINGSTRMWWYQPDATNEPFVSWRKRFGTLLDMVDAMLAPLPSERPAFFDLAGQIHLSSLFESGNIRGCCRDPGEIPYIVED